MENHQRPCLRCQSEMIKVNFNAGSSPILIEDLKAGFFKGKFSGVAGFVCQECGFLELVAEKPDVFRK